MRVRVECYAGRKADERPVRFHLDDRAYAVEEIVAQWYEPAGAFFKVRADDGKLYILCRAADGEWSAGAGREPEPV
jgi:hypothetical protein